MDSASGLATKYLNDRAGAISVRAISETPDTIDDEDEDEYKR
jgi:hypothetical protein